MNKILSNSQVQRHLPDWRAIKLTARVPIAILRQARDISVNTPDSLYFQMLESVGIDAVCDMVSQGCFAYDVAMALDIPVPKFREWIENSSDYIEKMEIAEEISAEAYLSASNEIVMGVNEHDTDAARVAKMKADHLKWLASTKDGSKYGKNVNHKHTGASSVVYNINLAAPVDPNRIVDVPMPALDHDPAAQS